MKRTDNPNHSQQKLQYKVLKDIKLKQLIKNKINKSLISELNSSELPLFNSLTRTNIKGAKLAAIQNHEVEITNTKTVQKLLENITRNQFEKLKARIFPK